jgi:hypothetical protein
VVGLRPITFKLKTQRAKRTFGAVDINVCCADKPETRDFLANGYFTKATLAVEIIKVRCGVKYSTTRPITLVVLMNGQPV